MTGPRITLLGSAELRLRSFLEAHPQGHERAAAVLFKRFASSVQDLETSDRFVAVDVIPFEDRWLSSSSSSHVAFRMGNLRRIFQRCEEESLVFGFVHNHPGGPLEFSTVDEANELTLLRALANRNGQHVHLVALLYSAGKWIGRVRNAENPDWSVDAQHVLVLGERLSVFRRGQEHKDGAFLRQAAAFGQPFVDQLRGLRIAVVGAGGTGSPTITLLARAGVRQLVVVDNDALEESNLNRVRGATLCNVGKNKAEILKEFVVGLGLSTSVAAFQSNLDEDPAAIDALSTCDVVFGCTDDQVGREVMNISVYFYGIALIDVGLGGQISPDRVGQPMLRYHFGRVSTVLPEFGECLFCQGVITEQWIQHQYALRDNPNLTAQEAAERYLQGGGEQAPGVGPFTSAVADFGVATLFDLLKRFRSFPPELRRDAFRLDFVRMEFRSVQEKNDLECPYCRKREFLLPREAYRLNRPALGRAHAQV